MWWRNYPRPFSEKPKLSISLDQQSKLLYSFIVCYVEGNQNILKLSGRSLAFHQKLFWETKRGLELVSLPHFCIIFEEKYFSYYILVRLDLKICWLAVTRVCFFEYTRPVGKKKFCIILSFKSSLTD